MPLVRSEGATPRGAMRTATAVAVAALVAIAVFAETGQVGAANPSAHGYWWRLQSGLGPSLTPPGVPEGGLWVTADPSGDQAISAVRVAPPAGAVATLLTLQIAEQSGTLSVVACPATSSWEPAQAGTWDKRPDADCAKALVSAALTSDGTALTVPLTAFGGGDHDPIDIVLIADVESTGYFSVAFDAPGTDSVTLASTNANRPARPAARPTDTPLPTVAPATDAAAEYQPPQAGFASPIFESAPAPASASELERDVAVRGGPPTSAIPEGARQPAALLAFAIVAAGWVARLRAATAFAPHHPLARGHVAFAQPDPTPTAEMDQ